VTQGLLDEKSAGESLRAGAIGCVGGAVGELFAPAGSAVADGIGVAGGEGSVAAETAAGDALAETVGGDVAVAELGGEVSTATSAEALDAVDAVSSTAEGVSGVAEDVAAESTVLPQKHQEWLMRLGTRSRLSILRMLRLLGILMSWRLIVMGLLLGGGRLEGNEVSARVGS
jgi:hypothetical protein